MIGNILASINAKTRQKQLVKVNNCNGLKGDRDIVDVDLIGPRIVFPFPATVDSALQNLLFVFLKVEESLCRQLYLIVLLVLS